MRISGQTIAAQEFQIVELLAHTLHAFGRTVASAHEELADNLSTTVAFLIEIYLAVLHAEDAEVGRFIADSYLWQDVLHQIGMQRVVRGEMSNVLFWHRT